VLQPLVYSKFRLVKPDDAALDAAPLEPCPMVPASKFRIIDLMNEPAMQAVYEDWFKGNDVEWTYWLDALHFVISGRAEITYWDPPNWTQENTVIAEPGSFYLTPRGSRVKWRILSDEPFRHVVFDIPNGGYDVGD
jgi:ethanolamine utilization protein EutQ (cupin superfamily)